MKEVSKFVPPADLVDNPLMITPQVFDKDAIKETLEKILKNEKLDTMIAVAPFISKYFPKFLEKTSLKNLILVINRDSLNPEYVNDAINKLKEARFNVTIRERPEKSRFVHMKLMIPYVKYERMVMSYGKQRPEAKLLPLCVICGSVNFTKNGITESDEILVILKDMYSINTGEATINELLNGSKIRYDASSSREWNARHGVTRVM